jgi:hypothetical protein
MAWVSLSGVPPCRHRAQRLMRILGIEAHYASRVEMALTPFNFFLLALRVCGTSVYESSILPPSESKNAVIRNELPFSFKGRFGRVLNASIALMAVAINLLINHRGN